MEVQENQINTENKENPENKEPQNIPQQQNEIKENPPEQNPNPNPNPKFTKLKDRLKTDVNKY